MRGGDGHDRLAVHSYVEHGDEVAFGDPTVTDEERVAAGRETLLERSRALVAQNRRRAADRYAAGPGQDPGPDEGEDGGAVRVWFPRDPADLRRRLGDGTLAVWAEADVLQVLWRGRAEQVGLAGGVQPQLWPVPGAEDLWEASLRIRDLDRTVVSVVVVPWVAGAPAVGDAGPDHILWRGSAAPPAPDGTAAPGDLVELAGTVEEHVLDSSRLGAARGVTVYRPPASAGDGPWPACVMADGQSVAGFAPVLERAVLAGAAPGVLLVGVHSAAPSATADLRGQEYLPGLHRNRFRAHLEFVTEDVLPWAAGLGEVAPGPWLVAGCSNGAAWAIAAAQRRPDLFAGVAAFSAGMVPRRIAAAARTAGVRHYLAAGRLEPGFRRATREWADRLQRARMPYRHQEWPGGHDAYWWGQQLPPALAWLRSAAG